MVAGSSHLRAFDAVPSRAVLAAAAVVATPALSAEPTFDCASPASSAEEAVCSSDALASLDVELDRLYRAAADGPGMTQQRLDELRATQRGWIKGRDDCWKAGDDLQRCVRDEYALRIYELRQGYSDARREDGASLGPFPWVCEGLDVPLSTVFVNGTEALAVLTWGDDWAVLPQARSGSGARYEAGPVLFWTKGEAATFAPQGGSEMNCSLESME